MCFWNRSPGLVWLESNVPTPPLHRSATAPHSRRAMVITTHLWRAWLCCPDIFTLFSLCRGCETEKVVPMFGTDSPLFLFRLYSIAKQAEELSQQLMTVNLGEKENWKATHAWGHRHKLLQVSHTQHVSSSAGSPFMHLLPCHSLWPRFIYPFVPATFWSTNAFKGCPWNNATQATSVALEEILPCVFPFLLKVESIMGFHTVPTFFTLI